MASQVLVLGVPLHPKGATTAMLNANSQLCNLKVKDMFSTPA
jgi:hypothetical protein